MSIVCDPPCSALSRQRRCDLTGSSPARATAEQLATKTTLTGADTRGLPGPDFDPLFLPDETLAPGDPLPGLLRRRCWRRTTNRSGRSACHAPGAPHQAFDNDFARLQSAGAGLLRSSAGVESPSDFDDEKPGTIERTATIALGPVASWPGALSRPESDCNNGPVGVGFKQSRAEFRYASKHFPKMRTSY